MKKDKTFFLGLLLLLTFIGAGIIICNKPLTIKPPAAQKKEIAFPRLPNIEIARKVLGCLEGIRNSERRYIFSKECPDRTDCKLSLQDDRVALYVLWGRTKYVQKTGDQAELEKIRRDINLYLDNQKVPLISPNFWSKRLLYEMWQSQIFSPEDKTKIEDLAEKVVLSELPALDKAEKKISGEDYQEPDIAQLLSGEDKNVLPEQTQSFMTEVAFSGDFLSDYLWRSKERSLKVAKELFYQDAKAFLESPNTFPQEQKCLLGLTASEFYQGLKEQPYLNLAAVVFTQSDLENSCFLKEGCTSSVFEPLVCGLFTDSLYRNTGEVKYGQIKDKYLSGLIEGNFDYSGYKNMALGDGCFFTSSAGNVPRLTLDNGLMVGFLAENE